MKVTRDVVTDLLPLYLSGDASDDTRRLVDDFMTTDPEFAEARPSPFCRGDGDSPHGVTSGSSFYKTHSRAK